MDTILDSSTTDEPERSAAAGRDAHGNPTTGATDVVERYDRAIDRLVRFHPDVVEQMTTLADEHPTFAMGQVLSAYLHLMSTDAADLAGARSAAATLEAAPRNDRETAHLRAVEAWLDGDWHGAARHLDDLLVRWPADVLALAIGHQLDFFCGDARNLRDRVGRSLDAFDPAHPHHGFVAGMLAFGLEESGHYGRAESAALEALDANPDDVWALHAAAHCYEMQGRVDAGIRFMESRVDDWGDGNLFTVHNWWHLALYHLEESRHDRVFEIYDTRVHHDGSDGVPIEMLDASALLWRLHLDGVDVGDRFARLADAWAEKLDSTGFERDGSWYVFNDVHAVMAFVGAGRMAAANDVVARLAADLGTPPRRSNHHMTAEVGLPASRAVVAFGEQRHDAVVETLWPARRTFHHFGGSHAQRDALERTLLESAVRADRHDLARRLVSERLTVRPNGRFALDRRAIVG